MQRTSVSFQIDEPIRFKQQMLDWANQFGVCCFLDSHDYPDLYHEYDCVLGAGAHVIFEPERKVLAELKTFLKTTNDWLFGHFSYDLKNEIDLLASAHEDRIRFPLCFLFQPEIVITLNRSEVTISSITLHPQLIFDQIAYRDVPLTPSQNPAVALEATISRDQYLQILNKLKAHIVRGDIYEINFCQEFFSDNAAIDPLSCYQQLSNISPAPFAAFYKLQSKYLLCASPERFMAKRRNQILSQPIKGTIHRSGEQTADQGLKNQLLNSAKDRSENVMVVDVVRNDLSKICKQGSVMVDELFGIYSFPQVHQMISTITGDLQEEVDLADILRATFPMASMTGAPKTRVMQLIDQYEHSARGIFSGTIGYITPQKNFDFNVIIRSIMFNAVNKCLSYQVGSGVTHYSVPEQEYEECLLKAEAITKVLGKNLNRG